MPDVLEPRVNRAPGLAPRTRPDERAARRSLLDQVERLEAELASLFCSTWPRKGFEWGVPGRAGPRLLSLGELEELRDDLADRVRERPRARSPTAPTWRSRTGCRIEEMLLDPGGPQVERVSHEDIGEPGCRHWHVRPRMGLLGMLARLVARGHLLGLSVSRSSRLGRLRTDWLSRLTADGTA